MIKQIDEIPLNVMDKRKSYREMIRNDIQEAIEQRIDKFEFEGDYNWKYLAQYAREEADQIWRSAWFDIMRRAKDEHGLRNVGAPDYRNKGEYIRISSVRMPDRIHVYCQIDFEAPERICRPLIEKLVREKEQRDEQMEAKDPSMDIFDVGFTYRTCAVLRRAGYSVMGDLKGKTREDLMRIRNAGKKTVDEVVDKMRYFGMEVE